MTRLPRLTGKEVIKALKNAGFEVVRIIRREGARRQRVTRSGSTTSHHLTTHRLLTKFFSYY